MHAISYEQCMLGFWYFIYKIQVSYFSSWKNNWPVFYLVQAASLLELGLFEKDQNEILSARYLQKYLS